MYASSITCLVGLMLGDSQCCAIAHFSEQNITNATKLIPKLYEFLPLFCDFLHYFLLMLMYNCYTLELKAVNQHDFTAYIYTAFSHNTNHYKKYSKNPKITQKRQILSQNQALSSTLLDVRSYESQD